MEVFTGYSDEVTCGEVELDSAMTAVKVCGSHNVHDKVISLLHPCHEVLAGLVTDLDFQLDLQRLRPPFQLVLHYEEGHTIDADLFQTLHGPFMREDIIGIEIHPIGVACNTSFKQPENISQDFGDRVKMKDLNLCADHQPSQ